jgi:hypothetical protein
MKQFLTIVFATIVGRVLSALIGFAILAVIVLVISLTGGGNQTSTSDDSGLSKAGVTLAPENPQTETTRPCTGCIANTENQTDPESAKRDEFGEKLRTAGITYMNDEDAWQLAKRTCTLLEDGETWDEVTAEYRAQRPTEVAVQLEAVYEVCPQFKEKLPAS